MNPLLLVLLAGGGYVAYKKLKAPANPFAGATAVADPTAGMNAADTALYNQMVNAGQTSAQNSSGQ